MICKVFADGTEVGIYHGNTPKDCIRKAQWECLDRDESIDEVRWTYQQYGCNDIRITK